jgi:hypothetical protein
MIKGWGGGAGPKSGSGLTKIPIEFTTLPGRISNDMELCKRNTLLPENRRMAAHETEECDALTGQACKTDRGIQHAQISNQYGILYVNQN